MFPFFVCCNLKELKLCFPGQGNVLFSNIKKVFNYITLYVNVFVILSSIFWIMMQWLCVVAKVWCHKTDHQPSSSSALISFLSLGSSESGHVVGSCICAEVNEESDCETVQWKTLSSYTWTCQSMAVYQFFQWKKGRKKNNQGTEKKKEPLSLLPSCKKSSSEWAGACRVRLHWQMIAEFSVSVWKQLPGCCHMRWLPMERSGKGQATNRGAISPWQWDGLSQMRKISESIFSLLLL